MSRRLEAVISGRVQMVSFRHYTQQKALELGVVGWVRNEPDGTVRTVAEGEEAASGSSWMLALPTRTWNRWNANGKRPPVSSRGFESLIES